MCAINVCAVLLLASIPVMKISKILIPNKI